MTSYRDRIAAAAAMHHSPPNALVSRILQVALGLFVTTSDLPSVPVTNPMINYDCSFDMECRWTSAGTHFDRWRVAKGEPDSLLWLAATGTMQLPSEPFSLIEIRGQPTDVLISDAIACQDGTSSLSFIYWSIGNADLEVCLTDLAGVKFNCTGMLQSPVMPGKVLLKIPEMQKSFRIMISPNTLPGILIVDDIRYDAQTCEGLKSTRKREHTTTPMIPTSTALSKDGESLTEEVVSSSEPPSQPTTKFHSTIPSATPHTPVTTTTTTDPPTTKPSTTQSTTRSTTVATSKLSPPPTTKPASTLPSPSTSTTPSTTTSTTTETVPETTTTERLTTTTSEESLTSTEQELTTSTEVEETIEETTKVEEETSTEEDIVTSSEESSTSDLIDKKFERTTAVPRIPKPEKQVVIDEIEAFTEEPISKTTMSILKKMELWRMTSHITTTTTTTTTTEATTTTTTTTTTMIPPTTTDQPFDLLIHGNKTSPLFDRRLNMILSNSSKLLCDFKEEFACQWGAEAGRWAIVQEGAIPTLEEDIGPDTLPPTFPAALVLQGTVMLTSDPIRCQKGQGKVLFRMWSNGNVTVQVCALGYGIDSTRIECFDRQPPSPQDASLAVFELPGNIKEAFTLNLVPQWEAGSKNKYLIVDEIAYLGECVIPTTTPVPTTTEEVPTTPEEDEATEETTTFRPIRRKTTEEPVTEHGSDEYEETGDLEETTPTTAKFVTIKPQKKSRTYPTRKITTTSPLSTSAAEEEGSEEVMATYSTTRSPPRFTSNGVRSYTTTPRPIDYCSLLNCNFDDSACNYLNHGLTKVPWTLRNRGYGYPLSGSTDVRPVPTNGQFVSSLLAPGDVAILESPKFNLSTSLNVLLFQYYRPTQSSTIRLCLGSRYTTPLRTVAAFARCPSILRAVTARNAYRWNTVHVQLPPGTTHFFLVAHNSERAETRTSIALDNMRVAICDPKNFAPEEVHRMFSAALIDDQLEVDGKPRIEGVVAHKQRIPPLHSLGEFNHNPTHQTYPQHPQYTVTPSSRINPFDRLRSYSRLDPEDFFSSD